MARPARRRPTLPDHDPRAIRAALRREIYELGDSLRFLDDIEFRVSEEQRDWIDEPSGPALELTINGESMRLQRSWAGVPARVQWVPNASLRDRDGHRRVCIGACRCDATGCSQQFADIEVAGRYVVWRVADRHFGRPLVFDRASYRESLEAALSEVRARETADEWALREILDRASWAASEVLGLRLYDAHVRANALELKFDDQFWRTLVKVRMPWDDADLARTVRACLEALAQGETHAWDTEWHPPYFDRSVRPPYPEAWRRVDWAPRPSVNDP